MCAFAMRLSEKRLQKKMVIGDDAGGFLSGSTEETLIELDVGRGGREEEGACFRCGEQTWIIFLRVCGVFK